MTSSTTPSRSRSGDVNFERGRRPFGVLVALPEDAGAAFGADDRVVGVLQHRDAVADADSQRTAAAAFADDDADDRRLAAATSRTCSRR